MVNIQVQWALKTGQLNPQATYTCVMVANGNAVPLTGPANPFQATGTFSQAIPYSGPTTYQFYASNNDRPDGHHGVERAKCQCQVGGFGSLCQK